jgi:hypothetical protein
MKKSIYIFLSLLLILGCSSTQINIKYDKNAEYSRYETYGWLKTGKQLDNYNRIDNQELEDLIQNAINTMMQSRGYELISEGDPDILVTFYAGVTGDIVQDESGYTYGKWFEGDREIEQEGILLIDIIDNETRELFWRGRGNGLIDDPETARAEVTEITQKIFKQFPERGQE